jgi:hypothetical protein
MLNSISSLLRGNESSEEQGKEWEEEQENEGESRRKERMGIQSV